MASNNYLPDFIIVGAPKCATTSIHTYLSSHSSVSMSEPKELNYFSKSNIIASNCYYKDFTVDSWDDYVDVFGGMDESDVKGEASVSYFTYPEVSNEIKRKLPHCKIIIVLRNPYERAFSHYLMDKKLGFTNVSFFEHLVSFTSENSNYDKRFYTQYITNSLYYQAVKYYFDAFGKENVLVLKQEELSGDVETTLSKVAEFLCIEDKWNFSDFSNVNFYRMPKNKLFSFLYSMTKFRKMLVSFLPRPLLDKLLTLIMTSKNKPVLSEKEKLLLCKLISKDLESFKSLMGEGYSSW